MSHLTFDRVEHIDPHYSDQRDEFVFHVTIGRSADGCKFTVHHVDAAGLQTYSAFQRFVLKSCAIWFQAPEYQGRSGAANWSEDIGELLPVVESEQERRAREIQVEAFAQWVDAASPDEREAIRRRCEYLQRCARENAACMEPAF